MDKEQTVSEMIRSVASNHVGFMNAIADRFDMLEARLQELEQSAITEDQCNDENT